MNLPDYLAQGRGTQAVLCGAIRAHSPDMTRWARGERPVPTERCPAIERATAAQVTCEELRPDVVWVRVPDAGWPHPGGRPCIDVAAPVAEVVQEQRHAA